MRGIVVGVVSSLITSLVIAWAGNERLDVARGFIKDQSNRNSLTGWHELEVEVTNRGILPGRFKEIPIETMPVGNRGVMVTDIRFSQKTLFPLVTATYEVGFGLRETGAPLPFALKIRFVDNDGQWDEQIFRVICINNRPALVNLWQVIRRPNGQFTLETPDALICPNQT